MNKYPLEHRINRTTPFNPDVNVAKTIAAAKKKGPLVGPVRVVTLAPFDLNHPDHPRWVGRRLRGEESPSSGATASAESTTH